MTPIFNCSVRIIELIVASVPSLICEYFMGLNIFYTISVAFVTFAFITYLEIYGINHKICNWIIKSFNIAIPLKEALAVYANSASYEPSDEWNKESFKRTFERNTDSLIPEELFTLLQLARDNKLTFYGRKSFSSPKVPLKPIPIEYFSTDKLYWSDDYSTIYFDKTKSDVAYTDISLKKKELSKLF